MATLAALSGTELGTSIAALRSVQVDGSAQGRAQLRALHELLIRATPLSADPPERILAAAAEFADELGPEPADAMTPRPRTVFRLLRSGVLDAAWEVLIDNATGVVEEPFGASTATGSQRTAWRLPLLTRLEPPRVFADLPGFRDPRYGAPDDCYDITEVVRLRHELDEVVVDGSAVTFGGWCALDALATGPEERVRLVVSSSAGELTVDGRRLRRPDLQSSAGAAGERKVWAGWSSTLELGDPRLLPGSWALTLRHDHRGIVRSAPLGRRATDLARMTARQQLRIGSRAVQWKTKGQWHLVVTDD
jgi:hypothetical protein